MSHSVPDPIQNRLRIPSQDIRYDKKNQASSRSYSFCGDRAGSNLSPLALAALHLHNERENT